MINSLTTKQACCDFNGYVTMFWNDRDKINNLNKQGNSSEKKTSKIMS